MLFLLTILACGGAEPAATPKPAVTSAAPAAAAKPAAAPAEVVGPDGPSAIVVPAIATLPSDEAALAAGKAAWEARGCGGCHKFGEKLVGPDLNGVLTRRSIPWAERMILFPDLMTKQDPEAKKLFASLMVQMPKQGVTETEIGPLLAYIHSQGG